MPNVHEMSSEEQTKAYHLSLLIHNSILSDHEIGTGLLACMITVAALLKGGYKDQGLDPESPLLQLEMSQIAAGIFRIALANTYESLEDAPKGAHIAEAPKVQ